MEYKEYRSWNPDAVLQQVEQAVAEGRGLYPEWKWPMLGPYNGHSGALRIIGWQKISLATRLGLMPWAKQCTLCGAKKNVQYHCEDYTRPTDCHAICSACHGTLHKRYRAPDDWLQLVAKWRFDGAWFDNLPMQRVDETNAQPGQYYKGPIRPSRTGKPKEGQVRHRTRQ